MARPAPDVPVNLPVTESILLDCDSDLRLPPLVVVQHARPDTLAFLDLLRARGWSIEAFLPIPYSISDGIVKRFSANTHTVVTNSLEELSAQLTVEIARIHGLAGPLVVQEVGGYLADALFAQPSLTGQLVGVVEETKQGLWRYQQHETLDVAVVQIADSRLKKIEARYVGGSVALSALERVRAYGQPAIAQNVGVIGYGDIGSNCARTLRGLGNTVVVVDSSPERQLAATSDGFIVGPVREMLDRCRLVVGCTGKESLLWSDFAGRTGRYYLASGSSRDVEFAPMLDRALDLLTTDDRSIEPPGLSNSALEVIALRGGFPVNFDNVSLPHSIIDLIFAQIAAGLEVLGSGQGVSGIHSLTTETEERIAEMWLESYSQSFRPGSLRLD